MRISGWNSSLKSSPNPVYAQPMPKRSSARPPKGLFPPHPHVEVPADGVGGGVGHPRLPVEPPPRVRRTRLLLDVLVGRVGERPSSALALHRAGGVGAGQKEVRDLVEGGELLAAPGGAQPLVPRPAEEAGGEGECRGERHPVLERVAQGGDVPDVGPGAGDGGVHQVRGQLELQRQHQPASHPQPHRLLAGRAQPPRGRQGNERGKGVRQRRRR